MSASADELVRAGGDALAHERPLLVVCHSPRSGPCRRARAHLAQVLQRNRNHDTFRITLLDPERRPELARRLRVERVPTLLVVERSRVVARLEVAYSLRDLRAFLDPWLLTGDARLRAAARP